jgi:type IV secretion system protein TrbL
MPNILVRVGLPLAFSLSFVPRASAALDSNSVLDSLTQRYADVANHWGSVITGHATTVFWLLAVISLAWTFGILALRRAEFGEVVAEAVRFIMFTGFYFWLLTNGTVFAKNVIDSLFSIGSEAGASDKPLNPTDIITIGFKIYDKVFSSMNWMNVAGSVVAGVLAILILIVLAYVAVNVVLALLSSWLLMYAGIIYLGFGGSRWTSDLAINYYKAVLGIGVKVMVMMLIIGIGGKFLGDCFNEMSADVNVRELGIMVVVVIALAVLSSKVPDMVAGIVSGSGIHHGAGHLSMGMVMGAAMMGGNMAARAVTSVMGGAGAVAGLAGSGGAVQNAFSSAQQHISNGVGRSSGDRNAIENVSSIGRFAGQMLGGVRHGSTGTGSTQIGSGSQSGGGGSKILQSTTGKGTSVVSGGGGQGGFPNNPPASPDPIQTHPMTADQARGFEGPEPTPDITNEAKNFIKRGADTFRLE